MSRSAYGQLVWLLRRAHAMSGPERRHRVDEQLKRIIDRRRRYGWDAFRRAGPSPVFPGLERTLLANSGEGLTDAIDGACEVLLAGEFEALGVRWPTRSPANLFPAELWRLDPVTGGLWPAVSRSAATIDYRRQTALGSVKYVWEINRLQFLQPLAVGYALRRDPRMLEAIETAISSWYEANPPFCGLGWASGIELALRALSLIVVSTLCGEALKASVTSQIGSILEATFYWLDRYPSRFSSANNHLICEAFGLFLIGTLMPDLPGASHAAERAGAVLESEVLAQILPDGVGGEQSPTYAALTAECLLTAALLARAVGRPLVDSLDRRLEQFAECIAWFALPSGETPAIGDDDEGRIWNTLGPRETAYSASVAGAVCGYLGRPALAPPSHWPELRDVVFGSPHKAAPSPTGVRTFADGGYTIVRERRAGRDLHLVMDHGPLGYLSIAAHGHADANALTLAVDETPVLIDPGTFMYHGQHDWRSWFRGTRAHNTLSIGSVDQSQISGPFMWSHKANARLQHLAPAPQWSITASHDGYRRNFGVDHQRSVTATNDGLLIVDTLVPAPCDEPVEVAFQFAPNVDVRLSGAGVLVSDRGRPLLSLEFGQPGDIALQAGGEGHDQGWASLRFGHKVAAPRLSWRGRMPAEGLTTRITLAAAPEPRQECAAHAPIPSRAVVS